MLSNGKIHGFLTHGENHVFLAMLKMTQRGKVNVERDYLIEWFCESLGRPEKGIKKALAKLDHLGIIHGWDKIDGAIPKEIGITCEYLFKTSVPRDQERECPHPMCYCRCTRMKPAVFYMAQDIAQDVHYLGEKFKGADTPEEMEKMQKELAALVRQWEKTTGEGYA